MSLDQGIFSLNVTQREDDRTIVDLIDSKGVAQYTKRRLPGVEYKIEVYGAYTKRKPARVRLSLIIHGHAAPVHLMRACRLAIRGPPRHRERAECNEQAQDTPAAQPGLHR